jgi:prokaryotic ubiquitin-like protein Pup
MPGQEHQRPARRDEEPDEAPAPAASAQSTTTDDDVDAILDEIDDVLESNSEAFIRDFVQKGGE